MNVKANQAILELPCVGRLFIAPSCGDDSNSLGAAYYAYVQHLRQNKHPVDIPGLSTLYWGGEFSEEEILQAINGYSFRQAVDIEAVESPDKKIARLLSKSEIVARFNGRMEFGARSLGNRSILADASNPDVPRTINNMIKMRDFGCPLLHLSLVNVQKTI